MIEITVKNNSVEAFNKALIDFKKVCNKDGFLKETIDRRYYKKPSEKRREQLRQSARLRKMNNEDTRNRD